MAQAVVTLSTKLGKVCSTSKSLSGSSDPTFAHIHLGAAGTSGNIVLPLSTGTTLLAKGCVPASATLISSIAANPHRCYVNIHSTNTRTAPSARSSKRLGPGRALVPAMWLQ